LTAVCGHAGMPPERYRRRPLPAWRLFSCRVVLLISPEEDHCASCAFRQATARVMARSDRYLSTGSAVAMQSANQTGAY